MRVRIGHSPIFPAVRLIQDGTKGLVFEIPYGGELGNTLNQTLYKGTALPVEEGVEVSWKAFDITAAILSGPIDYWHFSYRAEVPRSNLLANPHVLHGLLMLFRRKREEQTYWELRIVARVNLDAQSPVEFHLELPDFDPFYQAPESQARFDREEVC